MIEVRAYDGGHPPGECSACTETAPQPTMLVLRVGGRPSAVSLSFCESCAKKALNAFAFMYASASGQSVATALGFSKGKKR